MTGIHDDSGVSLGRRGSPNILLPSAAATSSRIRLDPRRPSARRLASEVSAVLTSCTPTRPRAYDVVNDKKRDRSGLPLSQSARSLSSSVPSIGGE